MERIIWLYGLSGAGKSTLAQELQMHFLKQGEKVVWLDGDILREGINKDLGFSHEDRRENIRRVSEIAKILQANKVLTICSFITPTTALRGMVREIVGRENIFEIFVDCPIETCIERDVKGLYQKAISGEIPRFTGISAPFDPATGHDLVIKSHEESVDVSLAKILDHLNRK